MARKNNLAALERATEDADLIENDKIQNEIDINTEGRKSVLLPLFWGTHIFQKKIKGTKYSGLYASYIREALREKMERDGIDFDIYH